MSSSANSNPQAGQGRPLPKKESDLFKSVVKHYETKQYKKGIKASDTILKKFPNHGETLCMKGLTVNCTGKRDEAHALVKKGLMNDMSSHVCWHVYGLLHRSDRNYNEAIKAYKQALRIDPENLQILRDLSLLQVQMRDLNGFVVTRHAILTLKSNQKINWLTFALSKHLMGDLPGAVSVIDIYLGTLSDDSPDKGRNYESGELALYKNSVLAEIPDNFEKALENLDECKDVVVDEGAWLRAKATYQLQLGRHGDAKETFLAMLKRGMTEDYRVHAGYMCASLELDRDTCNAAMKTRGTGTVATMGPLPPDQRQKLLDAYRGELPTLLPRSHAVRRIPLTLLEGDDLKNAVDAYCRKSLTKGVPSLGSDLSALFLNEKDGKYVLAVDPVDVKAHPTFAMVVELVEGYIPSLSSESKFPGEDSAEETPSTLLWAWYLRSLLHELCGEYTEAIALADECLDHTPTAVDVYELKARLLKAAGDISEAAECLDVGRELDKQDRYINNQTTKYMLQAGRESVACDRIALFTRHEGNPEQNLFDMQCAWYELELAECLARKEQWGKSLKKFMAVEKHFDDFHEDQFDFHAYCIRKVTLRSYIEVLRFEDELWGQSSYGRAAEGIIGNYLHLYDNPIAAKEEAEPDYSSMTAAQRKKAKAIARKKKKAAEKKKIEEAETTNGGDAEKGNAKKSGKPAVVDEDPDGEELLKRDPLEECKKYCATLAKNAPNRISTWIMQYDVSIRRKKVLMAMQALFKAKALDAESSDLFSRIVDLSQRGSPEEDSHAAVKEVIASEMPSLLNGKSVAEYVDDAAGRARSDKLTDLSFRIAIAKALVSTKSGSIGDASSLIIDDGLSGRGVTVDSCREALACLDTFGEEAAKGKLRWIASVKERFPLIKDFA